MIYKEIKNHDIECNPKEANAAFANNANHLWCDLFVFVNARGFVLDSKSKTALKDLSNKINEILDK